MIDEKSFQTDLFDYLKSHQEPGSSFVDEVADVLSISTDSAYRRMRGDKFMLLPELIKLCEHFEVPINELVEVSNNKLVSFRTQFIEEDGKSIDRLFNSVLSEMNKASNAESGGFIFLINDLNLFQLLQVPELAAFKFYFWQKSGLGSEEMKDRKFNLDELSDGNSEVTRDILKAYLKINTIELFSSDIMSSAMKQIVYYHDMGFIPDRKQAIYLMEKLLELSDHLQYQAETGRKHAFGYSIDPSNGEYLLYYNDLMTVDNIILGEYDEERVSYLTNNLINVMKSTNKAFYDYNKRIVENLIKRSELLSGTSERKRTHVFNNIKSQIKDQVGAL